MEELLNKLIEKGWKPFDVKWISEYFFESVPVGLYRLCWKKPDYDYNVYSKRELLSKESWLWQYVCENGMVALKLSARMKNPRIDWEDVDDYNNWHIVMNYKQKCEWDKAEYRIIESALCNEEGLEKFLLENIKIEWD